MPLPEVLIADDDKLLRTMLKDALSNVPCTVSEMDTGTKVLSAVSEREPAVLMLDLIMPGMSGLEVLKALHAQALKTRIFVLSSLHEEVMAQQAMADGAHGYLIKPIHPLEVENIVRAAIEAVNTQP